jgi:hydrogenase/urease accessory protein HupE
VKLRAAWLLAFGVLAAATPASAHLVTTGLGPFYDGLTHLAVSPTDLMAVIALAFLAGLGGPVRARAVMATLPAAWLVGGLAGLLASEELLLPLGLALALLVLGVLVAADAPLPRFAVVLLAAAAGILFGGLNGTALAEAGAGPLGLVGIVAAATVILFLLAAAAVSARAPWQRIVVRIAGSWIAAIAILMLGWSFAQEADQKRVGGGLELQSDITEPTNVMMGIGKMSPQLLVRRDQGQFQGSGQHDVGGIVGCDPMLQPDGETGLDQLASRQRVPRQLPKVDQVSERRVAVVAVGADVLPEHVGAFDEEMVRRVEPRRRVGRQPGEQGFRPIRELLTNEELDRDAGVHHPVMAQRSRSSRSNEVLSGAPTVAGEKWDRSLIAARICSGVRSSSSKARVSSVITSALSERLRA